MLLSEYSLGVNTDELYEMYKESTSDKFNFFKIDCETSNMNIKFSHNWSNFFELE